MLNANATLTIGKVAEKAEVRIDTVRYYERAGLIPKPGRTQSGYRTFSTDTVDRILFIKQAQELGFTLAEIRELLSLKLNPRSSCASVKKRTERKIADIEDKMERLARMKNSLFKLTQACDGRGDVSDCPILDALEVKPERAEDEKVKYET